MHQLMSSLAPIATAKADVRLGSQRDREAVARRFHRGPSTFPTETCQTYARASTWCTPPRGCSGSGWSAAGLRAAVRMSLRSCVRAFCNSRYLRPPSLDLTQLMSKSLIAFCTPRNPAAASQYSRRRNCLHAVLKNSAASPHDLAPNTLLRLGHVRRRVKPRLRIVFLAALYHRQVCTTSPSASSHRLSFDLLAHCIQEWRLSSFSNFPVPRRSRKQRARTFFGPPGGQ
jgi:hypothetical protein